MPSQPDPPSAPPPAPRGSVMQARTDPNDPRFYSINRDLAHNFSYVAIQTARCLEAGKWSFIEKVLADHGCSDIELGEAAEAFCRFGVEGPTCADITVALAESGWFRAPEAARFAYLAVFGSVMMGVYHGSVRDAKYPGSDPLAGIPDLVAAGRRCAEALRLGPRGRRWKAFKEGASAAWRALLGRTG